MSAPAVSRLAPSASATSWSRSDAWPSSSSAAQALHERSVVRLERLEEVLGGPEAERERLPRDLDVGVARRTARRAGPRCPTASGEGTPAGGGTCCADDLEHLADEAFGRPVGEPDAAARAGTPAASSAAARSGLGVNITPKVESTASKLPSANGRASASATRVSIGSPVGLGPLAGPVEQRARRSRSRSPRSRGGRRRATRCRCRRRRRAPASRRTTSTASHSDSPTICRVVPITA